MNSRHSIHKPPFAVFLATTVVIFFLILSAADSVGFVPNYIDGSTPLTANGTAPESGVSENGVGASSDALALNQLPTLGEEIVATVLPTQIQIPSIDLDLKVQNPSTKDIGKLDELLKNGPARYVDSAKLGGRGNMIIFAHSSHLPIVHNQMYKAFNRVPELNSGDTITLTGDDGKHYLYAVDDVRKADAAEDIIPLAVDGTKLTLVTCDTLTSKSSRFILTATLVGTIDT
jgi:LPXTG-site transpeptidase (sortase) family protein